MNAWTYADQAWSALNGIKESLIHRCENYASLTIPKICLPDGFDELSTDQTHDYQSIGAQATNGLTNKIMLALFAPSRPFFRADAGEETMKALLANGLTEQDIQRTLGQIERKAVKSLDSKGQRPKLYTLIKHLIVTGNALLVLSKDSMRVIGIKNYCVKRCSDGKVHTILIKECVKFDELEPKAQAVVNAKHQPDSKVNHYKWIVLNHTTGDYEMSQWVDSDRLPDEFDGKWPEDKLPYRVLTWDLADESDYGTGLVEEYRGDLEALSVLSEAIVNGAVLGSEFRWMLDPTSMASVEDVRDSQNGDVLTGKKGDLSMAQGGNPTAIATANEVMQRYERRISFGFLMNIGMTRDAERVTAEEIRMTANELETAFGGTYSVIANNIQKPIANWLLADIGVPKGFDVELSIITGLDALSRNADLENLRLAMADLAQIAMLPPELQGRIKYKPIADYIGNGRGIDISSFLKSEEEYQQYLEQQAQARVQENNAVEAGAATAQATAQQGTM
jgi:hypothetical protein